MISVVIPLYNKAATIEKTLAAVLAQTYTDFEVVIVNDGSTDDSVARAASVTDPRLRIVSQQNAGVSAARNRGIREARGEFVAFLDADDLWNPGYLAAQAALAARYPECSVYATNYRFVSCDGNSKDTVLHAMRLDGDCGVLDNYFEVASCSHPPLWTSAVMARRDALLVVEGFPVGIKSGEDLLTWARLACRYKIAYNLRPLAVFQETPSDGATSKARQRAGGEGYILSELLALYHGAADAQLKSQLKQYVIRWYKIYGVLQIEIEQGHKAFSIAAEALRFGGSLKTFLPIIVLSLLPEKMSCMIFNRLRC